MRCFLNLLVPVMAVAACVAARAQMPTYNLGRPPSAEEIRGWDISVGPAGKELPPGRGTAKQGAPIYAQKCAVCHGPTGTEALVAARERPLVGGNTTLNTVDPRNRSIGSFWPFATTIWDFTNRAMPLLNEGSLSADEVYALTAWILWRNGIIQESDVMDAKTLPKVQMPNRNAFVPPWPDWKLYQACPINLLKCADSLIEK